MTHRFALVRSCIVHSNRFAWYQSVASACDSSACGSQSHVRFRDTTGTISVPVPRTNAFGCERCKSGVNTSSGRGEHERGHRAISAERQPRHRNRRPFFTFPMVRASGLCVPGHSSMTLSRAPTVQTPNIDGSKWKRLCVCGANALDRPPRSVSSCASRCLSQKTLSSWKRTSFTAITPLTAFTPASLTTLRRSPRGFPLRGFPIEKDHRTLGFDAAKGEVKHR